jgi:hypothetical protein
VKIAQINSQVFLIQNTETNKVDDESLLYKNRKLKIKIKNKST